MKKLINITCVQDIQKITYAAASFDDSIQVTDSLGNLANAKSILGLLALDYTKPATLACDDATVLKSVYSAVTLEEKKN